LKQLASLFDSLYLPLHHLKETPRKIKNEQYGVSLPKGGIVFLSPLDFCCQRVNQCDTDSLDVGMPFHLFTKKPVQQCIIERQFDLEGILFSTS